MQKRNRLRNFVGALLFSLVVTGGLGAALAQSDDGSTGTTVTTIVVEDTTTTAAPATTTTLPSAAMVLVGEEIHFVHGVTSPTADFSVTGVTGDVQIEVPTHDGFGGRSAQCTHADCSNQNEESVSVYVNGELVGSTNDLADDADDAASAMTFNATLTGDDIITFEHNSSDDGPDSVYLSPFTITQQAPVVATTTTTSTTEAPATTTTMLVPATTSTTVASTTTSTAAPTTSTTAAPTTTTTTAPTTTQAPTTAAPTTTSTTEATTTTTEAITTTTTEATTTTTAGTTSTTDDDPQTTSPVPTTPRISRLPVSGGETVALIGLGGLLIAVGWSIRQRW